MTLKKDIVKKENDRYMDLEQYINSFTYLNNLVYSKNSDKNSPIKLENEINLNDISMKTTNFTYKPTDENDNTLIFESRFESGNLLAASRQKENEYQLILQCDTNTLGYTKWFYFMVTNTKKGLKVKFNIINQQKNHSEYSKGMKIMIYSEKKSKEENIGWYRGGTNINFERNGFHRVTNNQERQYSTLTIEFEFDYEDDTVFFANTIPYTYSTLYKELNEYEKDEKRYYYISRKTLCTTLAGNVLDYLTIADTRNSTKEEVLQRPGIIIMARVHPGETVGSFIMKGVIEFLASDQQEAIFLRKNYIIKIIPMLNPDGVILGNFRTSLAGCDLNRRWDDPSEFLHPEIYSAKKMILKFSEKRSISLIIDLHGHSSMYNSFIYANHFGNNDNTETKVFPYVLSKINKSFWFPYCCFKMQKYKSGAARINLFNELNEQGNKVVNIFTLEASFFGCKYGEYSDNYFNIRILKEIGKDICRAILIYYKGVETTNKNDTTSKLSNDKELNKYNMDSLDPLPKGIESIRKEILSDFQTKIQTEIKNMALNKDNEKNLGESDSGPSDDNLEKEELKKLLPKKFKKNKQKKTRVSIDSAIKEKKKVVKELKPVAVNKTAEKKEINNNINVMPLSIIKKKVTCSLSIDQKDKEINESQSTVQNSNIIKYKEQVTSLTKPSDTKENVNFMIKSPQSVILYLPKRVDKECQTEEIFFSVHWSYFFSKGFKIITVTLPTLDKLGCSKVNSKLTNKKVANNSIAVKIIDKKAKLGVINHNKTNDAIIRQNTNDNKEIERPASNIHNINNNNHPINNQNNKINKPTNNNTSLNQVKKEFIYNQNVNVVFSIQQNVNAKSAVIEKNEPCESIKKKTLITNKSCIFPNSNNNKNSNSSNNDGIRNLFT